MNDSSTCRRCGAEQREPVRRRVALKIIKLGMNTKQVVVKNRKNRCAGRLMPRISDYDLFEWDLKKTEHLTPAFDTKRLHLLGRLNDLDPEHGLS